jgi:hypothetical protein
MSLTMYGLMLGLALVCFGLMFALTEAVARTEPDAKQGAWGAGGPPNGARSEREARASAERSERP